MMQHWRLSLEGANRRMMIQCDHKNLEYFQKSNLFSQRQARCAENISSYDIIIEHVAGNRNPADGTSRWPDYRSGYERPTAPLSATSAAVGPYDDLLLAIKTARASDTLATDVNNIIFDYPIANCPDVTENGTGQGATDLHQKWNVISGAFTYKGRIYVPEPLHSKVIGRFHENPETGHFGALRTAELIPRDFY